MIFEPVIAKIPVALPVRIYVWAEARWYRYTPMGWVPE